MNESEVARDNVKYTDFLNIIQISWLRKSKEFIYWIDFAHLRQQCHDSKCVIFQERLLKVLKCYNFLWVQWRHNCSLAASFANCVKTLHLLKVHLQTFLSIPITQKCQILSYDTLVANERYIPTFQGIYVFRSMLVYVINKKLQSQTISWCMTFLW